MKDGEIISNSDRIERVIRVLIFMFCFLLLINLFSGIKMNSYDQFLITGFGTISFMIVNTYYPIVVFKN